MTDPQTLVLLFPGQGTEAIGMSEGWTEATPWLEALEAMETASGYPLRRLMAEGPVEVLQAPRQAPCAVVAHSVGLYRAHRRAGMPMPVLATGHSLGFFSAVVVAGVVPLEAVADLITAVEDLSETRFGPHTHGMAFFIGLSELELRQALVGYPGLVLSNLNGKAQFTVSGPRGELEALVDRLAPEAMKSGLLPVRHPLHGVHMVPLLPEVTRRLARWSPREPDFPLLSHADGRRLTTGREIWDEAIASVGLPVCWLEVVKGFQGSGARVCECGYGSQLANLTRWADRDLRVQSLQPAALLASWRTDTLESASPR